jgi:hypothetical protein
MVLTYDAYSETLQSQKESADRLSVIENQMKSLITAFGNMEGQSRNEFAKQLYASGIYRKELTQII